MKNGATGAVDFCSKILGSLRLVLVLHEGPSENHGIRNSRNRGLRIACSRNNEGPKIENATDHTLTNLQTFHLGNIEFHSVPTDKASLSDDSLVRKSKLCRLVPNEGDQPENQPQAPSEKKNKPDQKKGQK